MALDVVVGHFAVEAQQRRVRLIEIRARAPLATESDALWPKLRETIWTNNFIKHSKSVLFSAKIRNLEYTHENFRKLLPFGRELKVLENKSLVNLRKLS